MLAPDKLNHLYGGAAAALACGILAALMLHFGAEPLSVALVIAGAAAGGAIEGMQWVENRAGLLVREVSLADFIATAAPAWAAAAAWQAYRGL